MIHYDLLLNICQHFEYNERMSNKKLLICAHPDDETIFFGGLLLANKGQFKVICVTDANADNRGKERQEEFKNALKLLGVKEFAWLGFPDIYEKRITFEELSQALKAETLENYSEVYTHNILGEYGHPHHQDVSYCVHKIFSCPVYSTAYNSYPEFGIQISEDDFKIKSHILTHIYGQETQRFLNLLPISATEGYHQTSLTEIECLYDFFIGKNNLQGLDKYKHLESYLQHLKKLDRPF
jgi:hypothetical protein